jgi:limonene-1,2-epoxide hydrolase
MHEIGSLLRRSLLVAGLAGALAVSGVSGTSFAAGDATHKANMKVVADFIASWSDPDKAVTYLAPDASVRMVEDQPPVVGPEAVAAAMKGFMTPGVKLTVKTLHTTAYGPVVVNQRIDTMKTPGKPDQVFPVVGVFVVKNGKIAEWTDYLEKK